MKHDNQLAILQCNKCKGLLVYIYNPNAKGKTRVGIIGKDLEIKNCGLCQEEDCMTLFTGKLESEGKFLLITELYNFFMKEHLKKLERIEDDN